jgi:plasmid stabilization system protein ParE
MKIRFLETARLELDDAIAFYNAEVPGFGEAFLLESLSAIDRIRRYPDAWSPLSENTRRCRLRRFPYALIYRHAEDEILIVAVAHLHRKPQYWKDRIH